jgi:DNA polymerase III subunit epsilon
MTIVTGIDFETTGLDTENDRIIEIGIVQWDWEAKKPLMMESKLVNPFETRLLNPKMRGYSEDNRKLDEHITKITGIDSDMIGKSGLNYLTISMIFYSYIVASDYVMAHNAEFDKAFAGQLVEVGHQELTHQFKATPWICSKEDIPYSNDIKSHRLTHLAAEHGFVNPFPHRALPDVLTMLRIASEYPLDEILEPSVRLEALVSYEFKDLAKDVGYKWNPDGKSWTKKVKVSKVQDEYAIAEEQGFNVITLS